MLRAKLHYAHKRTMTGHLLGQGSDPCRTRSGSGSGLIIGVRARRSSAGTVLASRRPLLGPSEWRLRSLPESAQFLLRRSPWPHWSAISLPGRSGLADSGYSCAGRRSGVGDPGDWAQDAAAIGEQMGPAAGRDVIMEPEPVLLRFAERAPGCCAPRRGRPRLVARGDSLAGTDQRRAAQSYRGMYLRVVESRQQHVRKPKHVSASRRGGTAIRRRHPAGDLFHPLRRSARKSLRNDRTCQQPT